MSSKKNQYVQGSLFTSSKPTRGVGRGLDAAKFTTHFHSRLDAIQAVIKKLRHDDLSQGHCFMVFDVSLPEDQAYYEYPDGRILIEQVDKRSIEVPRVIVRELNKSEVHAVRKKHAIFG